MTPCLKRDTFKKPSFLVSMLDFGGKSFKAGIFSLRMAGLQISQVPMSETNPERFMVWGPSKRKGGVYGC